MVVGLDIDETITRHPAFFALLSSALIDAGHRVIIITYREDRAGAEEDLRGWGIAYSELITWTLDSSRGHEPDCWKAAICREYGVEVFFDDDPDILRHLDENIVCLKPWRKEEDDWPYED